MLVFALCTALIVAMQREFTLFYQRGANIFLGEQAYAYLKGAEELAVLALMTDSELDQKRDLQRDDLQEVWAQEAAPYALDEGGWLMGGLEDLQGRFNINALVSVASGAGDQGGVGGDQNAGDTAADLETEDKTGNGPGLNEPRFNPAQMFFIRLLQTLDEPEVSLQEAMAIVASASDWLDADINPTPDGAEDDYYSVLSPPYRSANGPVSSASELRAVANMTPEIYNAIRPWITAWPQVPATLNIHTAPLFVLRGMNADDDLSPLNLGDAEALVEYRNETGFADKEDFLANPVFSGMSMAQVGELLGETSDYFLLSAEVEVAERRMRLYSVLQRNGGSVNALTRASGSL